MKKTMKRIFSAVLALSMSLVMLTGCGSSSSDAKSPSDGETVELRLSHTNPASSAFGLASEEFAKLVNEKTNGRYHITVYNDGQLGDERDSIEAVQLGNLDFAIVNVSVLANFVPQLSVFDLPYVIQSTEHADKVFKGDVGDQMMEWISGIGVKGLGVWESGFRNLTNSVREVNSLEDVAGLRIRVMESELHQKLWIALGADAVPMAWGEAYTALQQGALDGEENPLTVILSNNVASVNEYLAMTEHVYSMVVPIMSQKLWDSMSDEDKAAMEEVMQEMMDRERELARAQNEEALGKLEEAGMKVSYPDKAAFIEATQSIRDEYGAEYADILEQVNALA